MQLRDELFKLYNPIRHNANILVRCRHHPVQLRLVAKAAHLALRNKVSLSKAGQFAFDRIVYRNYID